MQRALLLAAVLWSGVLGTRGARADLWLYLSSGAQTYNIQDNGALDADPLVGWVAPSMASVGNFSIGAPTVGYSFVSPTAGATIDLHLDVTAALPGETLTAMLSETDIAAEIGLLTGYIGGASYPAIGANGISFTAALDDANNLYGFPPGSTIGPILLGGGVYSGGQTLPVSGTDPYSLSQLVTITSDAPNQNITFDSGAYGTRVPEPTSVLLWVVASGVGIYAARRRRARGKGVPTPARPGGQVPGTAGTDSRSVT